MQIEVIGLSRRESTNKNTGAITVYTNIYGYQDFSDYEKKNGAQGFKCVTVNTSQNTSHVNVGDRINANYEPTGFTDKNGSPQFRISSIDVVVKAADKKK